MFLFGSTLCHTLTADIVNVGTVSIVFLILKKRFKKVNDKYDYKLDKLKILKTRSGISVEIE